MAQPGAEAGGDSLPRRIAGITQSVAEGFVDRFQRAIDAVVSLGKAGGGVDWAAFGTAAWALAVVAVASFAAFIVLRWLASRFFAALSRWALNSRGNTGLFRRLVAVIIAATADAIAILLAWVGGYAVALFVLGDSGSMAAHQTLFLNAFLLVEVFKAFLRLLFASRYDGLRLLPLAAEDAAYWSARLIGISSFIGYGLLLLVPVVSANLSSALADLLTPVVMFLAFVYATVVILRNRTRVRARLVERSQRDGVDASGVIAAVLARTWHLLAIGYFAAFALITVLRPKQALPFMVSATLESLLAVGVGVFVSLFLGHLISHRIELPEQTRRNFPQLEDRLNGFVPKGLHVVRLVIAVIVIAVVLNAWRLIPDLGDWLATSEGQAVLGAVVSVTFILSVASLVWILIASWVEHRLNPEAGKGEPGARERTLLSLFRNAIAIAIVTLALMISLSQIGIDIGPLIAGAGVLGLAIGFGAQKLVQDIITGVFIQLENAINTGDVITAGGISGTAERLSIRSVGIRDLSGTFHIVPFSSVDTVSNYMRGFAFHLGVYRIAYGEDVGAAIEQLQSAFNDLRDNPEHAANILADLEVHGVTEIAESSVHIRVRIKTLPGAQWSVGRAYNLLVKRHLDAAGIEIPHPRMTLFFGEDKQGETPAANLRLLGDGAKTTGRPVSNGEPAAAQDLPPTTAPRKDFGEEDEQGA